MAALKTGSRCRIQIRSSHSPELAQDTLSGKSNIGVGEWAVMLMGFISFLLVHAGVSVADTAPQPDYQHRVLGRVASKIGFQQSVQLLSEGQSAVGPDAAAPIVSTLFYSTAASRSDMSSVFVLSLLFGAGRFGFTRRHNAAVSCGRVMMISSLRYAENMLQLEHKTRLFNGMDSCRGALHCRDLRDAILMAEVSLRAFPGIGDWWKRAIYCNTCGCWRRRHMIYPVCLI